MKEPERARVPFAAAVLIAIAVLAAARNWGTLQLWLRENVPWFGEIVWWFLGLAVLAALHRGVARLLGLLVLPALFGVAAWHNFGSFDEHNEDTWRLERHRDPTLLHQAQKSPQKWAREWLSLYLYLHDELAGRRITVPSKASLNESYLRNVAGISDAIVESYDPTISAEQVGRILERPHAAFPWTEGTRFVVVAGDEDVRYGGYRLFHHDGSYYLFPEAWVAELGT